MKPRPLFRLLVSMSVGTQEISNIPKIISSVRALGLYYSNNI